MRGDNVELAIWDNFSGNFLYHFFSQELMEAKVEEFVYLKQGIMTMKEYTLKFHLLSCYALELVSSRGLK